MLSATYRCDSSFSPDLEWYDKYGAWRYAIARDLRHEALLIDEAVKGVRALWQ